MRHQQNNIQLKVLVFQSTHPLRDATASSSVLGDTHPHFNPRTPYGMRRKYDIVFHHKIELFQSTHPLRDATTFPVAV